jgi:hypothetical protein
MKMERTHRIVSTVLVPSGAFTGLVTIADKWFMGNKGSGYM